MISTIWIADWFYTVLVDGRFTENLIPTVLVDGLFNENLICTVLVDGWFTET